MLINSDCLKELKKMDDCSIDMIYLDPPFYTQTTQKLTNKEGVEFFFEDKWESRNEYLSFLELRLSECRRILKDTGNIFVHCDSSASHYIKIMLDQIFGISNFRSEIIWTYKRWSNSKKGLLNSHQTIFYYSKSSNYKFNIQYQEYSSSTNVDQILQDRVRNESGKTVYKKSDNGDIIQTLEKKGVPLSDVWDIPFLNPKAKERVGYPTQKPIILLEKIIEISTDKGDIVLDPFCGSGTTLVASKLLERNYIGIDISQDAISITEERLQHPIKTESILLKKGRDSYKQKLKSELQILEAIPCNIVQRNKGIDAFLKKYYNNSPVAVRIQKEGEDIEVAIKLLDSASAKKKCSASCLILINNNNVDYETIKVPTNMIIIDKYESQINRMLKSFESL